MADHSNNRIIQKYVDTLQRLDTLLEEAENMPENKIATQVIDQRISVSNSIRDALVNHVKEYGVTPDILEKTEQRLHLY